MPVIVMTMRLVLAFVLLAAVVGKLSDRDAAVTMFADAGVPALLRRPAVGVLVIAEAVTAALLVIPSAAMPGTLAATLLFCLLTAGVIRIVRSGRTVACNCFGGSAGVPLGSVHIYRNVGLTALSATASALSMETVGSTLPQPATAFTALIIAAVVVRLDDLVDLLR